MRSRPKPKAQINSMTLCFPSHCFSVSQLPLKLRSLSILFLQFGTIHTAHPQLFLIRGANSKDKMHRGQQAEISHYNITSQEVRLVRLG